MGTTYQYCLLHWVKGYTDKCLNWIFKSVAHVPASVMFAFDAFVQTKGDYKRISSSIYQIVLLEFARICLLNNFLKKKHRNLVYRFLTDIIFVSEIGKNRIQVSVIFRYSALTSTILPLAKLYVLNYVISFVGFRCRSVAQIHSLIMMNFSWERWAKIQLFHMYNNF